MSETKKARVVIVGAGASSLQCAHDLIMHHGMDPKDLMILEARDRIGGRIHSEKIQRQTVNGEKVNFTLDHGAAWVHGASDENPMMELLQQTEKGKDMRLTAQVGNPWMRPRSVLHRTNEISLFVDGHHIPNHDKRIELALKCHFQRMNAVGRHVQREFQQGRGMECSTRSLRDGFNAVEKDIEEKDPEIRRISQFYVHLLECWYGTHVGELQLCEFDMDGTNDVHGDDMYSAEGDFVGPHCNLTHGMEMVLEPLIRNGVRDRIFLGQEVISLKYENKHVLVETRERLCVKTEYCVVTVSAGCLKQAVVCDSFFTPLLSHEKLEAISFLKMGHYKKVFLTFDHIFWPVAPAFLGLIRSDKRSEEDNGMGSCLLLDNIWAKDGLPCVEAVLFGISGDWATNRSDKEIRQGVLDFMIDSMSLSSSILDNCIDCHVTRWEEDSFSRGSYSFMGLGAQIRHIEALRKPEWGGRLYFSGEATITEYEGSVHAALFSGMESARRIGDKLSADQSA